jgi:hypothetical protein
MQKILPILFLDDTNTKLSKDLILNSIYHLELIINDVYDNNDNNNDNEVIETKKSNMINFNDLINSNLKLIPKILITSNEDIISKLIDNFSEYDIYFIGVPKKRLPFGINIAVDISEIIHDRKVDGDQFITKMDVNKILNMNYTKIKNILVILTGKVNSANDTKNLMNKIKSIKNVNDTILNTKIIYLGKLNKFSEKYLDIDEYIEVDDIDKVTYKKDFNCKIYNLVDDRYNYHWYPLSKYDNFEEINLIINVSKITSNNFNIINELQEIVLCDRESIFVNSDMAIGTKKIIEHYCNLFNCYGYQFKTSKRDANILFGKDQYELSNIKYSLLSDCNLFEHLNLFGDMILSSIQPFHIKKSKPKIILVTYYGIYEQFIYIKESLELVYEVINFPYRHYIDNFDEGTLKTKMKELLDLKPKYVLWWILDIKTNNLREIHNYNHNVKHIYFNWDEPFNFDVVNAKQKSKYLNYVFGTCQESMHKYIDSGALHANCLYTGYSSKIHYPYFIKDTGYDFSKIKYRHDVSFVLTNLYENKEMYPDQVIDRKVLVDNLYLNQKSNYKFAIYGPSKFKELYPNSYVDYIKYNDTCKLFNESKINICTHVIGNKAGYLNERVFLIMASGGLLLIDPIKGIDKILKNGYNCIYINPTKIVSQINKILSNSDYYNKIRINAYKTSLDYTWNDWAMRIQEIINQK